MSSPLRPPVRPGRREFLRTASLAAAGAAAGGFGAPAAARASRAGPAALLPDARGAHARNVIFMVADGMSTGTLTLADMLARRRGEGPSAWATLWRWTHARGRREGAPDVYRSMVMTHSLDSLVTDSAAGGSAWGCGVHVNNGWINMLPDGSEPRPILVEAKDAGRAAGLVTTTTVTHATPASFVANVPDRGMEREIARQILDRGVDVVLGGGRRFFPDELLARHPDVTLLRTARELSRADGAPGRVLGLFNDAHLSYALDRDADGLDEPTLAEMTRAALRRLERAPNGFVLQVEGGRVDHAAHNNDACSLLREQREFDAALAAAVDFARARDDTLLIVTTDHANANPGLTLYTESGDAAFARLAEARHSFDWIAGRFAPARQRGAGIDEFASLVREAIGVQLGERERDWLARTTLAGAPGDAFLPRATPEGALGSVLANHLGVSFVGTNHTADYVECTAFGPGAERLGPLIDNIDLHTLVVEALALA